ncbi:MAG: tetraacyldisaccharide 4'-kinase [Salinivirgaceae bacterium]|nr:tetraacyldisaccharide 4'-kinase [Salinivirgaceae bacterium]
MHWYLYPFSILYGIAINVRNKLFDLEIKKSKSFKLPIISIGNISVGGTGKTPHAEFLIEWLKQSYSVATLSRGYKRKTKGFVEVKTNSIVRDVGDEALQIKQKFPDVKVVVDEKRVNGVKTLLNEKEKPQVIVLDDAFQHRHIDPGMNILLIDYNKPITKDYLLPVGRLREPARNRDRANIIIVTKCPPTMNPIDFRIMFKELNLFPYQNLFFTSFTYTSLKPLFGSKQKISSLNDLKGKTVLCVTGIANPESLYSEIEKAGATIKKLQFSDHHTFTKGNINKIFNEYNDIKSSDKIILCTEKDAVKFKTEFQNSELINIPFFYVPIKVKFLNNEEDNFKKIITKFIGRFNESSIKRDEIGKS